MDHMSKTLLLVRHAKSSWENHEVSDIDRPLNDRGKNDLPIMAGRLRIHNFKPDLILHSSAARTTATAHGLLQELKEVCQTTGMESLYHAMKQTYLDVIRQTSSEVANLMVVGHNPTMTDLVCSLSTVNLNNMPTLGMCAITYNNWEEVGQKKGDIQWFEYPRQFKN